MIFKIITADNHIWNLSELLDFLISNQGKDIVMDNNTEGCCFTAIGLYDLLDKFNFSKVILRTANPLETHPTYLIHIVAPWEFLKVNNIIESELHVWNQKYIFGTLYGRPLWHRLGITGHLLTHHSSVSSVGCLVNTADIDKRKLFEIDQLWINHPQSFVNFSNIVNALPITHAEVDEYAPGSTLTDGYVKQTKKVYKDFLIDVVAETFISGNCFYITEKTTRPMLLQKPMIVMGPKNYLCHLRQMGFRTFGDFWDETYDGYEGKDRYLKILDLIDTLAKKSKEELNEMYWAMKYTLEHNYNLLIKQTYGTNITKI